MSLTEEIYAPDSLPVFPVKSDGQEMITLGKGHVAYGDKRHLVEIASYWEELREQFKNDEIKLDKKFWEGIILAEYMTVSVFKLVVKVWFCFVFLIFFFFFFLRMTSFHFVEPLVLFVLDFS